MCHTFYVPFVADNVDCALDEVACGVVSEALPVILADCLSRFHCMGYMLSVLAQCSHVKSLSMI